jgi:hypothetical protein
MPVWIHDFDGQRANEFKSHVQYKSYSVQNIDPSRLYLSYEEVIQYIQSDVRSIIYIYILY